MTRGRVDREQPMTPLKREPGWRAPNRQAHSYPSPDQTPGDDPVPVEVPQPEPTPTQDPIPHQTPLTGVYRLFSMRIAARRR